MTSSKSLSSLSVAAWILAFALLAVFPLLPEPIGGKFHTELLAKVMIMAIFAASLQLLVGYTGLVSLGHAAFFGFGAYAVAMLAPMSEAGHRRAGDAHAGHLLHHGDAGLRAARLLRLPRHQDRRGQRRRLCLLQARAGDRRLAVDRPGAGQQLLLVRAGCARADAGGADAGAALALRARADRHQAQRAAHARRRLLDAALQASELRRRGDAGRARRLPLRGAVRLRHTRDPVLALQRQCAGDDHPGRAGQPGWGGGRSLRVCAAVGVVLVADQALAAAVRQPAASARWSR